jgi:aryl carrier-like protein
MWRHKYGYKATLANLIETPRLAKWYTFLWASLILLLDLKPKSGVWFS